VGDLIIRRPGSFPLAFERGTEGGREGGGDQAQGAGGAVCQFQGGGASWVYSAGPVIRGKTGTQPQHRFALSVPRNTKHHGRSPTWIWGARKNRALDWPVIGGVPPTAKWWHLSVRGQKKPKGPVFGDCYISRGCWRMGEPVWLLFFIKTHPHRFSGFGGCLGGVFGRLVGGAQQGAGGNWGSKKTPVVNTVFSTRVNSAWSVGESLSANFSNPPRGGG